MRDFVFALILTGVCCHILTVFAQQQSFFCKDVKCPTGYECANVAGEAACHRILDPATTQPPINTPESVCRNLVCLNNTVCANRNGNPRCVQSYSIFNSPTPSPNPSPTQPPTQLPTQAPSQQSFFCKPVHCPSGYECANLAGEAACHRILDPATTQPPANTPQSVCRNLCCLNNKVCANRNGNPRCVAPFFGLPRPACGPQPIDEQQSEDTILFARGSLNFKA